VRYPGLPSALNALSGLALLFFAVRLHRSQAQSAMASAQLATGRAGFLLGIGLVVMNPASLVTWVILVGAIAGDASGLDSLSLAIGIGAGSTAWFVSLAHAAHRGAELLGERTRWIGRISAVLLAGYGLVSLGRAAWALLALPQ
jgi:threonine/homoserine/homoserine lactone efflux protein